MWSLHSYSLCSFFWRLSRDWSSWNFIESWRLICVFCTQNSIFSGDWSGGALLMVHSAVSDILATHEPTIMVLHFCGNGSSLSLVAMVTVSTSLMICASSCVSLVGLVAISDSHLSGWASHNITFYHRSEHSFTFPHQQGFPFNPHGATECNLCLVFSTLNCRETVCSHHLLWSSGEQLCWLSNSWYWLLESLQSLFSIAH